MRYGLGSKPDSLPAHLITFPTVIYSDGYPYWEDASNSSDIVVSVRTEREVVLPETYALVQNYPKAFSPAWR